MINCPNCGGLNGSGNPNCSFCGAPLVGNSVDPNFNNIQTVQSIQSYQAPDNFVEPVYDNSDMGEFAGQQPAYNPNNQDVFSAPAGDMSNDEMLINAYIKKNVDKLKAGGFSIWAFLFGGVYVWYRKMYKLLLIWMGISLVTGTIFTMLGIPFVSAIVALAFNIFIGIKFKDLYLKDVGVKVATIKSKHSEESPENIAAICSKKGGTTIVPIILFVILSIAIPAAVILILPNLFGNGNGDKKQMMYEKAGSLIEAVRADMLINEIKDPSRVYDIDDLNEISEDPLTISPYGKNYIYARVQAVKVMDGSYIYRVCLIDEGKNGFSYTNESTLSVDSVLEGNAPDIC